MPSNKQPLLNLKDLRTHLEKYLLDRQDEILTLNTLRKDPNTSFLYRTYCVEWPFERGNTKIRITVFRDLPSPYPEILFDQIQRYMRMKRMDAEFKFCSSFVTFRSLDPARIIRN